MKQTPSKNPMQEALERARAAKNGVQQKVDPTNTNGFSPLSAGSTTVDLLGTKGTAPKTVPGVGRGAPVQKSQRGR